ncbi:MAG: hypothetical protein ACOCXH_12075 [Cyclobacteriaceae bacterium]
MSNLYGIISICLEMERNTPSHSSGMLWVKKVGYYCLHRPKIKADDWILILDESIGIGQEKLLVILGIRASEIDFSRPLKIQDMEPIIIKSRKKWTGEDVSAELEKSKALIGKVIYATTDGSSMLKKALRLSEINHVYDTTHAIAIMLEKLYKENTQFKELTNQMGQMRLKLCCSQYAHIIPPNQRSKSRFLNIDILTSWCSKVLIALNKDDLTIAEKEQLQWVADKEFFIQEMNQIIVKIEELSIILKTNGLNRKTKKECFNRLKTFDKTPKQIQFKQLFEEYVNKNAVHITRRSKTIMCSSDIIETTFGKYKNELSKNPMNGITDLALIIPAFTSNLIEGEIKEAIDICTCKILKEWKVENLCVSLSAKRKMVFT